VRLLFDLGWCSIMPYVQPLIMVLMRNLIMPPSSLLGLQSMSSKSCCPTPERSGAADGRNWRWAQATEEKGTQRHAALRQYKQEQGTRNKEQEDDRVRG
jgi:hypothetical protein